MEQLRRLQRGVVLGLWMIGGLALCFGPSSMAANAQELPSYVPASLPENSLTSIGSDSMDSLMQDWIAAYSRVQPNVRVNILSRGSATAPVALIEGSADLGPMARPMRAEERRQFVATYGFEPTQVRTGYAAVAIYVSAENPLKEISFEELEQIFGDASIGNTGAGIAESNNTVMTADGELQSGAARTWGDIGLHGAFSKEKLFSFGETTNPTITSYFKQVVLSQRDLSRELMTVASKESLVEVLQKNRGGIAFGAYEKAVPAGIKMLAVKKTPKAAAVAASGATIVNAKYPLARELSIYLVREPGKAIEPALADLLQFMLSLQGQRFVREQGLIPLTAVEARRELAKIR